MTQNQNIIIRDKDGKIIYEQRSDGFCEQSKYINGKLCRQVTKYPNGIVETVHYNLPD